jgi:ketosteroid isomerase-like protein
MNEMEKKLDDLLQRVQALEDELAIHRLIVRYGFAVDIGDADHTAELFTKDTVYDVDVFVMHGRDDIRKMVVTDPHRSLVGNCAHQIGPSIVEVHGDRAVATGYSRVYLRKGDSIDVFRVSFNRFELLRGDGGWQITHRTTRLLGHAEARKIFAAALG